MRLRCSVWLSAVVAAMASSCLAYNEQCQGLVENPNEQIGFLGEEVFLDKPNARLTSNAIGQLVADAFVEVFKGSSAEADLGVLNGGAIRGEGLCVSRNVLKPGPITNGLLHEILLFENLVMAVDLTGPELYAVMENAVSHLPLEGQPTSASPPGRFLNVSGTVAMAVDCTLPAGSRVVSLEVNGRIVERTQDSGERFRLAASSFLFGGGDGFTMLAGPAQDPARNPAQAQKLGGIDSNIAADFMRAHHETPEKALRLDPARIQLISCATPPRPEG